MKFADRLKTCAKFTKTANLLLLATIATGGLGSSSMTSNLSFVTSRGSWGTVMWMWEVSSPSQKVSTPERLANGDFGSLHFTFHGTFTFPGENKTT